MANKVNIERVDEVRWRVPIQGDMRVEGWIYADDTLIEAIVKDGSVQQLANVATLPGIVGRALAMPDIHQGYGFPIGGVAAFDPEQGGVVSPGGVGYDINCGVRLHVLSVPFDHVVRHKEAIANELQRAVPAGVGVGKLDPRIGDLDSVLAHGAKALVAQGLVPEEDLETIEEGGTMPGADPDAVSGRARERGASQLGSLGSGNHFLEVGRVTEIYDPRVAERFGLRKGAVTLLVHSGSRGLGHQVCEEALPVMLKVAAREGIRLVDKQLACAPLGSGEARRYLKAMAAAANFAFANRALIANRALSAMAKALDIRQRSLEARLVYDVCHNIAKWEEHIVDGVRKKLCVHRKGATRAFAAGQPEIPARYRDVGQPVIIPGDMGRYSYVLCGTPGAMEETFGSTCHGAGRRLARGAAKKMASGRQVVDALQRKGIALRAASVSAVVEEMPEAYKDVAEVVEVVERAGISKRVARLEPVIVVKG